MSSSSSNTSSPIADAGECPAISFDPASIRRATRLADDFDLPTTGAVQVQDSAFDAFRQFQNNIRSSNEVDLQDIAVMDQVNTDLASLTVNCLKTTQDSSALRDTLIETITTILSENPEIVPSLNKPELFGAPTMQQINEVIEENYNLIAEIHSLRSQLAVHKQNDSIRQKEPDWRTNDAQTISSNLGKTRDLLKNFLLLPNEDFEVDWDLMEMVASSATVQAEIWTDADIASDASAGKWVSRICGLCEPIASAQSALHCAARLLALSFSDQPSSLADICTLAEKLTSLRHPHDLKLPLAMLQAFLCRKSQVIVMKDEQVSDAQALILLRGIELFHDHIRRVRELQTLDNAFDEIRPHLVEACKRSFIISALVSYLSSIFAGDPSSLITSLNKVTPETVTARLEETLVFMDGDYLIMVHPTVVQIVRAPDVQCTVSRNGWTIVTKQPPWRSRLFGFEEKDEMERLFCRLLDRLDDGNPPISYTEAELRISEPQKD